jgi:superfamily II DNA/RNA helicase
LVACPSARFLIGHFIAQARFLICTDVAARGIDIGGLPFMINYTLPDDKSNYVHRSDSTTAFFGRFYFVH